MRCSIVVASVLLLGATTPPSTDNPRSIPVIPVNVDPDEAVIGNLYLLCRRNLARADPKFLRQETLPYWPDADMKVMIEISGDEAAGILSTICAVKQYKALRMREHQNQQ